MTRLLLTLAIILIARTSHAQYQFDSDNPMHTKLDSSIDRSVKKYLQDDRAVGISIGVLIKDQPYYYNYGEIKAGKNKIPTSNTIYETGSITKTFSGILLAQAILDKKLNPDDDIRKYLQGSYPNLEYKGVPIHIKDLANHTSGISRIFPNMRNTPDYDSLNPLRNYTRQMLFEGLHNVKLDTFPGKTVAYSNMAVALLGAILEDVYMQSYFPLVTKNILEPYNMNDTRMDLSNLPPGTVASSHNEYRETVPFWDAPSIPAIGALRSTTHDLIQFIKANNMERSPAIALSHQLTFGTAQEGTGMNWYLHTSPQGYRILEHGGGTGGSRSALQCFPALHAGFVILTNSIANKNELEKEISTIVVSVSGN